MLYLVDLLNVVSDTGQQFKTQSLTLRHNLRQVLIGGASISLLAPVQNFRWQTGVD